MSIYAHIHTLPGRNRVKLPCFVCGLTDRLHVYPLICTYLYPFGHFQRHGDTVPLTEYTEHIFQQSLFSQLCTKTVRVLPAALLRSITLICHAAIKETTQHLNSRETQQKGIRQRE